MTKLPINYPEEYTKWIVHFFGRDFFVTPDVLIPRLETECLVKRARQILQAPTNLPNYQPTTVIDIGSGSGIIGTSVADLVDEVIFLDISETALEVTKKNFQIHFPDKKAQFIISDLLSNLPSYHPTNQHPTKILFLANLPYIKDKDWLHMSIDTQFEPKLALFGGEKTGFELYEKLFEQFSCLVQSLNPPFSHPALLFEFGFDQREIAEKILKEYPNWKYVFFADYAGVERFGEIML